VEPVHARLAAAGITWRLATPADLDARLASVPRKPTDLTSSDLYNVRTGKPERGGLCCSRIFGPVDDDACLCGKYEGASHRGVVCEKCGVLVGSSDVRRAWPGRIVLPVPIVHPWYIDAVASALEVPTEELAAVVPLGDRIEAPVMGVAIRERLGDAAHLIDALLVLPAGLREPTWREIDPAETAKQREIFEADRDRSWMDKRVYSESHLRVLTHEPIAGGLNRRYGAVVEGCARLRDFLDRAAPWPVIHAEEGELFAAIASLIGGSRFPRAARRTATPSSIAARIEAALDEGKDRTAVEAELLFAGAVATA
jgi:hypothetical protein